MLLSMHVKNLALIEETEVEFTRGLNILTGETGAGKSVLIGSVNLGLGAKFDKEMIRKGAESALVELCFLCEEEKKLINCLEELDIPMEDGVVTCFRCRSPLTRETGCAHCGTTWDEYLQITAPLRNK